VLQPLVLLLEERDAEELVLVLQGYYLLLTDRTLSVIHVRTGNEEIGQFTTSFHSSRILIGLFVIVSLQAKSILICNLSEPLRKCCCFRFYFIFGWFFRDFPKRRVFGSNF
jgi:hypothetical protein